MFTSFTTSTTVTELAAVSEILSTSVFVLLQSFKNVHKEVEVSISQ